MTINWRIVRALGRRDLLMYFSNPTGYVFITLFIFLSAAAAFWQERFFLNNLANLDQLNTVFPYLLLFFVPALTMAVWAEERKQGTDELLLTLPATDFEVVLGKYLATLGIYTVSLLLSFSHVLVLFWLGSPDLGLMLGNFFGYWLIGGALIAVGMVASLLATSTTIAFILGALFCALLVFVDAAAGIFSRDLETWLVPLGVFGHFGDFARGVVTLSGVLYFLSVTGLALYLNVLLIGRRHWPAKADGIAWWQHQAIRALALVVAVISINAIIGRAPLRLDVTAERLHSLSSETHRLLGELEDDRPVFVQAFISPEVPEALVQTRADLLSLLREIDAVGGQRVEVAIRETEPFTEAARDARERFGILPRQVLDERAARSSVQDVFMGLVFTCGAEEQVIPFFERGYPVEYEIVRSVRVVANTERKRIGVVGTALELFGGLDFQTMRQNRPWPVVEELEKQYEVVQVTPATAAEQDVDALLVALPSSLPQGDMDALLPVIQSGVPTLLLVDPLPIIDIDQSPSEQPGANQNPFMQQQQAPPPPKGNIGAFLSRLGVQWNPSTIVWDAYNPHPDLASLPPEVVFVGRGNQNANAFNVEQPASSALQELVLLYPGELRQAAGSENVFIPLAETGVASGQLFYQQIVQRSFFGAQLNRNLPHVPDGERYVVAAMVVGESANDNASEADEPDETETATDTAATASPLRVAVIADLDFISEQFFQLRATGPTNLNFDNVTFFLNAMDAVLGDEAFINLRSRRVKHRTLERVERQTQSFIEQRTADEQAAEAEADAALAEAQARLEEKVAAVSERTDLDAQTKQIMARNLQEVENRRFETLEANIETEKQAKIQASREVVEAQIRGIQRGIRTFAVLLPPIPVFIVGVWMFLRRRRREKEGAAAARRLRDA
ncbi:MAG: Gldg family protein [Acidobacteriota bacterium]